MPFWRSSPTVFRHKPTMCKGTHDGHRGRMRKRFAETGLSGFQPHEVLEMLLFYALPRRNTNPLAHRLLERFGSISGVLSASREALLEVAGIGEGTAEAFAFFRAFSQYLAIEESRGVRLASFREAAAFFSVLYRNERSERVCAAFLNEQLCLLHCDTVSAGQPSASPLLIRAVTERAFAAGCSAIYLAHNHPGGSSIASQEDIIATQLLCTTLSNCGIELVDHLIVGADGVTSLREAGAFFGLE